MTNGEMFQIIFNSRGSNIIDKNDLNNVIYSVNWGALLPTKYKKFRCKYAFKSEHFAGTYSQSGFINMSLSRMNCYDGLQFCSNLGILYPVVLNNNSAVASLSSYFTSSNDSFWIDYPQNTSITIGLKTYNGTSLSNIRDYILILTLVGIVD